jgi:hypothetical protein
MNYADIISDLNDKCMAIAEKYPDYHIRPDYCRLVIHRNLLIKEKMQYEREKTENTRRD